MKKQKKSNQKKKSFNLLYLRSDPEKDPDPYQNKTDLKHLDFKG